METRSVTIEEVVEAIAAAGYTQGFYHAIEWSSTEEFEGTILNACAIGQAALNLGVDPYQFESCLSDLKPRKNSTYNLRSFIVGLNDEKRFELSKIAEEVKDKFKLRLKDQITVPIADYTDISNYQGKKI